MAGYFSKLNGSVYEGEYIAATDLENGTFVELNAEGKVAALASANDNVVLRCVEKTDLWGLNALRLRVVAEDGAVFMVEQDFDVTENTAYNEKEHKVLAGKLVKMRSPHISDEITLAVEEDLYSAATVGAEFALAVGGEIVAKTESTD